MIVLLPALLAAPASAGPTALFRHGVTYCVGGYDLALIGHVDACELPAQAGRHARWHFHDFLTDGKSCWACWDEHDSTCETVFIAENPGWSETTPYDPICAAHAASDTVFAHVVDGQSVAPPPPTVTTLHAALDSVAAGPHAAGDSVSVSGSVRDESGAIRPVTGGEFRVTGDDGTVRTYRGTRRPDGSVVGDIVLPASAKASVEFVPDPPKLGANERMVSQGSAPTALQVETCRYRARVTSPASASSLASGASVKLAAALYDATNTTPIPTPTGTALTFALAGDASGALPADASLTATWTPPAAPTPRRLEVSASGTAGGFAVCPAGPVVASWSDLGLGFDTAKMPARCYQGMACKGEIRLVRPDGGAARARVDTLLTTPGAVAVLTDNGQELWRGAPAPDDVYPYERTHADLSAHAVTLTITGADGTPVVMPDHTITVRPPLRVVVPDVLDLGPHRAGDPWIETCKKLDMAASQAAEEHEWELSVDGIEGCVARPGLGHTNAAGRPELVPLDAVVRQPAFDPARLEFQVCLALPPCAADSAPPGAVLHLKPTTPEFADQARDVRLTWSVEGKPWYACHGWWMGPTALVSGLGFLLLGMVRPARFPPGAAVRVAGSEAGLKRASAILLRGCPGSRPGLYTDACLGVHGDGTVDGRTRGTPVQLRATRDRGVVLQGTGPLEVLDAGSRKWNPVEGLPGGVVPSPRATYRAGSTLFKVDPG